jgi:hypothetical protein
MNEPELGERDVSEKLIQMPPADRSFWPGIRLIRIILSIFFANNTAALLGHHDQQQTDDLGQKGYAMV